MNVLIQFAIADSGHFSFPLLAEGMLRTPQGDVEIIEYGRSKKEVLERVMGFADLHTETPNGKISREAFLAVHMRDNKWNLIK